MRTDAGPDDLAYVTYTSGSTGIPKGVEVRQRGVLRLLADQSYAHFGEDERILQLAPVPFDASTFEIWGALLYGGQCVLFPERLPVMATLEATMVRHGITTLWLTASLFNEVIDKAPGALRQVRHVVTGGEVVVGAARPARAGGAAGHGDHQRLWADRMHHLHVLRRDRARTSRGHWHRCRLAGRLRAPRSTCSTTSTPWSPTG